ncbi:MAG: 1-(5-phosphoribosyl)-5-[(5-phosphoribosylamino)methylideneamino]imidazole-4-carboxamide isomerase [bacterium]
MEIIPAIDLKDGKCVRLKQGVFSEQTVYSESPLEVALHFETLGATRLHLVNLDGAQSGRMVNQRVIQKVVSTLTIPVQLGGGIRSGSQIEDWLHAGVDRVIVGTLAVKNPAILMRALQEWGPERIVLAVDARDGRVAVKGWQEDAGVKAVDLALSFKDAGLRRVLYTDIARDGMFTGPALEATRELAEATGLKVIASGGVSSLADLTRLEALEPFGVESVVVGKAFYERKILPEEVFHAR